VLLLYSGVDSVTANLERVIGSCCPSVDELAKRYDSSLFPGLWGVADIPGNEVMGLRGLGAFQELIIVRVGCRCDAHCR